MHVLNSRILALAIGWGWGLVRSAEHLNLECRAAAGMLVDFDVAENGSFRFEVLDPGRTWTKPWQMAHPNKDKQVHLFVPNGGKAEMDFDDIHTRCTLTVHAAEYEKDAHFEIKGKGGKVMITYGGCEIPGFVMEKSGTDTYILEPKNLQ